MSWELGDKKNMFTHTEIPRGMTPSQTTQIQSAHSLGPKFFHKQVGFTQNTPYNTYVLSAVYDLHAVYFRLKPKLIFAGSWHGQ